MNFAARRKVLETDSLVDCIRMLKAGDLHASDFQAFAATQLEVWERAIKAFLYLDVTGIQSSGPADMERPLAGVSIGIKDMIDVAGMPTTGGSDAYRFIDHEDATAVAKLRDAGGHIVGKTNTQELAFGVVTSPTRNPWGTGHIPGGSSGGSAAAVAAGMVFAALGTDTGGSVRIPAACCGVVGLKPSVGRISKHGVMPLSTTFDHVGVLTRTVADAHLLYEILQGFDPKDMTTVGVPTFRTAPPQKRTLGIPWSYFKTSIRPETMEVFQQVVSKLIADGWQIEDLELDPFPFWRSLQLHVRLPEAYAYHESVLEGPKRDLLKGDLATRLDPGKHLSALDYVKAQNTRLQSIQVHAARMSGVDAVLMPTLLCPVPKVDVTQVDLPNGSMPIWEVLTYLTTPWNVLGFPAISLPSGCDSTIMPTGVQLVGLSGEDEYLLHLASEIETLLGGWKGIALSSTLGPI